MARTTIPAMMMKQRSKVFQNFLRMAGTSKKKFESLQKKKKKNQERRDCQTKRTRLKSNSPS